MFALQMLQLVLYHDIHTKLQNVQNDLQSDLFRVQSWLQANRLQLNVTKSVIMLLGSWQKPRNCCVSLLLNGKTITCVTTTRYLGVIIDQHLTWKAQVSYVLKKARYKLFALNR